MEAEKNSDQILIDNLCYNILLLVNNGKAIKYIVENLGPYFPKGKKVRGMLCQMVEERVEYLLYNKLIYVGASK